MVSQNIIMLGDLCPVAKKIRNGMNQWVFFFPSGHKFRGSVGVRTIGVNWFGSECSSCNIDCKWMGRKSECVDD